MNFRTFALIFWIVAILALLYIYFYQPWIYYRIFQGYSGSGGPFVNTPAG